MTEDGTARQKMSVNDTRKQARLGKNVGDYRSDCAIGGRDANKHLLRQMLFIMKSDELEEKTKQGTRTSQMLKI